MIDSVPCAAPSLPPLIGASSIAMSRSARVDARALVVAGAEGRAHATPGPGGALAGTAGMISPPPAGWRFRPLSDRIS